MRTSSTFVALVLVVGVAACGRPDELPPTPPGNLVAKADLEGEWLYASTVVDVAYGTGAAFVGETFGELLIIRWDIQEHTLYARLAYDRVSGTGGDTSSAGEIVGAWAVEHVDWGSDRKRSWFDRKQLLVDWSENLVTNWHQLWKRQVTLEPVGHSPTDPSDPLAPRVERDDSGRASYLEATARLLVTPQTRIDDTGTELPDCYFYGATTACTASEVVVRHAFVRRDPAREYLPRKTTAAGRSEHGVAETLRLRYDRDLGVTTSDVERLAHRFNLYGAWFRPATDETTAAAMARDRPFECPGAPEPCHYTDDQSPVWLRGYTVNFEEDVPAELVNSTDAADVYYCRSTADPYSPLACFFVNDGALVYTVDASSDDPVVLRPAARPLAPVAYHLSPGFPEELLPALRRSVDQWNEVLLQTVWLDAGCPWSDFTDRAQYPCATRPELDDPDFRMLVLCESSPVQAGDPASCGPEGTEARMGDVRYHHLVWVDRPLQRSPLGYGPALADPQTGEIRSANTYVFGAALDLQAGQTTTWVQMQTNQNFEWERFLYGGPLAPPPPSTLPAGSYDASAIQRIQAAMDTSFTAGVQGSTPPGAVGSQLTPAQRRAWFANRLQAMRNSGVLGSGAGAIRARLERLRDSGFEDFMLTPDHLRSQAWRLAAAGYDVAQVSASDLPYGSALRRAVSPLTRYNAGVLRSLGRARAVHRARTVLYPADAPLKLHGREAALVCGQCCDDSDRVNGQCPAVTAACLEDAAEQTWRWANDPLCEAQVKLRARELLLQQVVLHELGHNLGLRHNFKGSYDALNYADGYWEARKQDGTVGPRTSDPETAAERRVIRRFESSSIMDLGGLWGPDDVALGRWDVATVHHSYAGFRQVFTETHNTSGMVMLHGSREEHLPSPVALWIGQPPEALHYTRWHYDPSLMDTSDNVVDTSEGNRAWVPSAWIVEAVLGPGGIVPRTESEVEALLGDGMSRVQVPYLYCTDGLRGQVTACDAHDRGADPFEVGETIIADYHEDRWFNNWAWDRYGWGLDTDVYTSRIQERYFQPLRRLTGQYVLLRALLSDYGLWTTAQLGQLFGLPLQGWGTYTVAVSRAFEFFGRLLYWLQSGTYDAQLHWNPLEQYPGNCQDPGTCVQVSATLGHPLDDVYAFDMDGVQHKAMQGQRLDRLLAMGALAEPMSPGLAPALFAGTPDFAINFSRLFPDHVALLFAGIASGDPDAMAPSFCGLDSQQMAIVEYRDITALDRPRCSMTGGTFGGMFSTEHDFQQRLWAASISMAHIPTIYSNHFLDLAGIYSGGDLDWIDWANLPPDMELVEYVDPFSFRIYRAVRYPDADLGGPGNPPVLYSTSIAAQMLDHANNLKADYVYWKAEYDAAPDETNYENMIAYQTELQRYVMSLEAVRALTAEYQLLDVSE